MCPCRQQGCSTTPLITSKLRFVFEAIWTVLSWLLYTIHQCMYCYIYQQSAVALINELNLSLCLLLPQLVSLQEAKLLLKEDDELIKEVFDYWSRKRKTSKCGSLIPTVKQEKRDGSSTSDPYVAFRRRTEKMQTRKVRVCALEKLDRQQEKRGKVVLLHINYVWCSGWRIGLYCPRCRTGSCKIISLINRVSTAPWGQDSI